MLTDDASFVHSKRAFHYCNTSSYNPEKSKVTVVLPSFFDNRYLLSFLTRRSSDLSFFMRFSIIDSPFVGWQGYLSN